MSTTKYFLFTILICLVCFEVTLFVPSVSVYKYTTRPMPIVRVLQNMTNSSKLLSHDPNVENAKGLNTTESKNVLLSEGNVPSFSEYAGNLDLVSPYHRYWKTNCSAVFEMNHSVINRTNLEVDEARLAGSILMPSDKDMAKFTHDCATFKHIRKYPTKPRSEEERDFPLAYIILTHKDVAQVERLLRAIYQPQNIYCIHPDKKSPTDYQEAIRSLVTCFENVFIPSKVEAVQYQGITRVQADINCMADLLEKPVQWKYLLNLCGQDFPLKTNLEIVQQLKAFKGLNAISGVLPVRRFKRRAIYHHITLENGKLHRTNETKTPPPHNFTLYHGNAYIAATRAFTNYTVNDQRAIDLLKWSEDTMDPEEHYYVTLQRYPGVPGGVSGSYGKVNVRFVKWNDDEHLECIGEYVRMVCVFEIGYLNYLLSQPDLFANKFYYDNDPVTLQCLEEMLDYRQRYPKSIHQFVPEFPVTSLPWQNLDKV